jgi:hypothetical protein
MGRPKKIIEEAKAVVLQPKIKVLDNDRAFPKELERSKPDSVVVFNKRTGLYKRMSRSFAEMLIRIDTTGNYKIQ